MRKGEKTHVVGQIFPSCVMLRGFRKSGSPHYQPHYLWRLEPWSRWVVNSGRATCLRAGSSQEPSGPSFTWFRDCGFSEKLRYLPGFPQPHLWKARINAAGVVVFPPPTSPTSPREHAWDGTSLLRGSCKFLRKIQDHQRMLLVIISETKEFCLPGLHSGSTHHRAISLETSKEMKNKMAIKSFITVQA